MLGKINRILSNPWANRDMARIDEIYFREKLEAVLFYAGPQWGKPPTAEEFLSALDAAGFKIVKK